MSDSSIWTIDKTLSGSCIPGRGEPGSDGSEGVLRIHQSSSITGVSSSNSLVGGGLPPLQRCHQSIFQPQPPKLYKSEALLSDRPSHTAYLSLFWNGAKWYLIL